ncbi:hypothetical protein HanPSC8_Chr06g0238481 [Helianthus annuus]|nr:hypothetical protein HanPSC8_Chr06g0238481 [Helianthus annuus]
MRAEAEKLVQAARAGAEQLEKDKAAFEKQKQTSEWAAAAQLKQEGQELETRGAGKERWCVPLLNSLLMSVSVGRKFHPTSARSGTNLGLSRTIFCFILGRS